MSSPSIHIFKRILQNWKASGMLWVPFNAAKKAITRSSIRKMCFEIFMLEIKDIRITQTRRDMLASSSLPSLESRLVYFIKKIIFCITRTMDLNPELVRFITFPMGFVKLWISDKWGNFRYHASCLLFLSGYMKIGSIILYPNEKLRQAEPNLTTDYFKLHC